MTDELKDTRSTLHAVLEKGSYESQTQGFRVKGEGSSAIIKRQSCHRPFLAKYLFLTCIDSLNYDNTTQFLNDVT